MNRSQKAAAIVGLALFLSPVPAMAGTSAAASLKGLTPVSAGLTSSPSTKSLIFGPSHVVHTRLPGSDLAALIRQRTTAFVNDLLARIFNISRGA